MRPNFTFKFFKVLTLVAMMLVSSSIYATTGTKDENKNGTKKEQKEQSEQAQPNEETPPTANSSTENENSKEEGVSISNVSFNFIFYLIYKIKYAEIFKLPTRKNDDASLRGWSGVHLNRLYQKLTKPNI